MKGEVMETKQKLKNRAQASSRATATILLNDLLKEKMPLFGIFATAAIMLEYSLVHAKSDEAAKLEFLDKVHARLRNRIAANWSEVSDKDLLEAQARSSADTSRETKGELEEMENDAATS
jgi:hypothetical protein